MFVTRKTEFSASHLCRLPSLSEAENYELFGEEANPNGHGHNYVVEVTIEGDADPVSGMVETAPIAELSSVNPRTPFARCNSL